MYGPCIIKLFSKIVINIFVWYIKIPVASAVVAADAAGRVMVHVTGEQHTFHHSNC